jgi:hypothetical protein
MILLVVMVGMVLLIEMKGSLKNICEAALISNIVGILALKGAWKIFYGEIASNLKVLGVSRKVDIYAKVNDNLVILGEIERNREILQAELLSLQDAISGEKCEVMGFYTNEKQELDKELLWKIEVRQHIFHNIPVYAIKIIRGLGLDVL